MPESRIHRSPCCGPTGAPAATRLRVRRAILLSGIILSLCAGAIASIAWGEEQRPAGSQDQVQQTDPEEKEVEEKHRESIWARLQRPQHVDLWIWWDHGIRMRSQGGNFTMLIGGRLQVDAAVFWQDQANEEVFSAIPNDAELRRAMIAVSGTFLKRFKYKFEPDFGSYGNETRDMWVGMTNIPYLGEVRFGRQKQPLGLDEQTSSNDNSFMERALVSAFASSRTNGFTVSSFRQTRASLVLGFFKQQNDGQLTSWNVTGRFVSLPHYGVREDLLHLAVGVSYSIQGEEALRIRQRPEAHLAPYFVDTGSIEASSNWIVAPEVAWIHGRLSSQAEFYWNPVISTAADDIHLWSVYGQLSTFLTDDKKSYSDGRFIAVDPRREFLEGGRGAWEVGGRVSYIDLDSGEVLGGRLLDVTAGLNWYPTRYTRVTWNYIHSRIEPDAGTLDTFMMRVQLALR